MTVPALYFTLKILGRNQKGVMRGMFELGQDSRHLDNEEKFKNEKFEAEHNPPIDWLIDNDAQNDRVARA